MPTTTQLPAAAHLDRLRVDTIRMLSIDAVQNANSGHPDMPMALTVGELGKAIGTRSFGASSRSAGALYKHLGFTPKRVADAGRRTARRARTENGVR